MKILLALILSLPLLSWAAAKKVDLPLIIDKEYGNTRNCTYKKDISLGSSANFKPFQIFTPTAEAELTLMVRPNTVFVDKNGNFYVSPAQTQTIPASEKCASHTEVLFVQ